jgi:hypothetical protein
MQRNICIWEKKISGFLRNIQLITLAVLEHIR